MKTQNLTLEKNMTAYNLVVGSFTDKYYGKEKVFFSWIKNGVTGEMITWTKGEDLYVNSLSYKAANINRADMTGILSGIKELFPDVLGRLIVPDEYQSYQ